MKKWIKIVGAILFAIAISWLINMLLIWTSLWNSWVWRFILNQIEIIGVVIAAVLIIRISNHK